jgi:hypothetical protein
MLLAIDKLGRKRSVVYTALESDPYISLPHFAEAVFLVMCDPSMNEL